MVPRDRFTPHGYLDNPFHTRNLHPSGVVRSLRGIGFAWHYPALGRSYGFSEIYRAGARLYLLLDGAVLLDLADLDGLVANRHTANEVTFTWFGQGLGLEATWFLVGEHALACRARLTSDRPREIGVGAALEHERHLGAAGVWGESGLVGRDEDDHLVLQGFEDGEAFALWLDGASARAATPSLDAGFLRAPAMAGDHAVVTGRRGDRVTLAGAVLAPVALTAGAPVELDMVLGRGDRRDRAVAAARTARHGIATALAAHRAADASFWADAPQLHGDWPGAWRRGLAIDLETLRMMVRRPVGIYRHVWDAMQIQAPRVVLAEAAIDALLLSYADLPTAKSLLLGTFLDAPRDNVPCSREDGTFNMVAANGSECGTAPGWGHPVRVAAHLYARDPDRAWLEAIYPRLERFLLWWEAHRSDDGGYLVYDNSWESGQDLSARFGPQREGGGSTIRAVRPVDLQAAMADACHHMARFACALGRPAESWTARAVHYHARTASLWHAGAYRDFDARVGWSDVRDVMQLAPLALGLAGPEPAEASRAAVRRLADDTYLWPMFVWTAVDAAHALGEHETAAAIAHATIDRAYRAWDRRSPGPDDPLPGITCEYWGTDGRYGAEGYGWGAFGIHLLFRTLLGYQPVAEGFLLAPTLPSSLRGGRYGVRRLHAGRGAVDLLLEPDDEIVHVTLEARQGALETRGERGRRVRVTLRRGEALEVRTLEEVPA